MSGVEYSPREMAAVLLARELVDGEVGMTGASSEVPVAACLLAQLLHAPNLTLILPSGIVNPPPGRLYRSGSDGRWAQGAEAFGTAYDLFELSENGRLDFMFYGGVQLDRHGNVNLTRTDGPPPFRGPGLANISFAVVCSRIFLYTAAHDTRTFLERVDYLTAPGHLDGGDSRLRAGIATPGPRLCVSPLATLDFDGDGAMRVRSLHPGVAPEELRQRTGFELGGKPPWPRTPAPTETELRVLRDQVDRTGVLRAAKTTSIERIQEVAT